jgi:multiple sugar transport system substrate-binding protein
MVRKILTLAIGILLIGAIGEAKAPGSDVTLTFVRSGGAGEEAVVRGQIESAEDVLGIAVELQMVPWGQAYNKIMTMVLAGNAPDIAYLGSRWIPKLAEVGAIVPIYEPEPVRAEYFESIWPMVTWNGKIYGIPRAFSSKVVYYNTDLFKKAGIEVPPSTWAELRAAAKAISDKTEAYGFALAGEKFVSTTSQFFSFLFQNGGGVFDSEGDVIINNANGVEALEFYASLAEYAQPGPTAWRREELWQLFAEGQVGMYISGPWRVKAFLESGVPFETAPLPTGPRGSSATILVSDALVVFGQSEHRGLANLLALYITNFDNQMMLDVKWGMTPMRPVEAEIDFFKTPTWNTFIQMIPRGRPQPLVTDWEKLEDAVTDAIQSVLLNQKAPGEALDATASVLEGLR